MVVLDFYFPPFLTTYVNTIQRIWVHETNCPDLFEAPFNNWTRSIPFLLSNNLTLMLSVIFSSNSPFCSMMPNFKIYIWCYGLKWFLVVIIYIIFCNFKSTFTVPSWFSYCLNYIFCVRNEFSKILYTNWPHFLFEKWIPFYQKQRKKAHHIYKQHI